MVIKAFGCVHRSAMLSNARVNYPSYEIHLPLMDRLKLLTSRTLAIALAVFAIAVAALAQEQPLRIKYSLAMSHPGSHLFEVTIDVGSSADAKTNSLDFQMP